MQQVSGALRELRSLMVLLTLLYSAQTAGQEKNLDAALRERGATITREMLIPKTYAEILSIRGLTQKDCDLRGRFPKTPTGAALARVATLVPLGLRQDQVPEARQMAQDLALIDAQPETALADLESGFRALPDQYWSERQFLIQVGARLQVPTAAILSFLTREMSRSANVPMENPSLDYLSAVTAADTLVRVVTDPAQRDAAFRQAAQAQPNKNASLLILSRYGMVDSARATQLANDLHWSSK